VALELWIILMCVVNECAQECILEDHRRKNLILVLPPRKNKR
jgi:hypothetical protein